MKKRCLSLCLVWAMALSTATFATSTDNLSQRSLTYDNAFSDVTSTNVFYDNVVALYEYGLSIGKGDGTFGLNSALTLGEVLVFSARIRSLTLTGDAETAMESYVAPGQSAYEPYYLYLLDAGVVEEAFVSDLYATATRAQVAHVLANTLPDGTIENRNSDVVNQGYALGQFITDVDEYTPYYWDILTLYCWGISGGYDVTGTFDPLSPVSRGAAAAMLTRMVDPDLRIMLDWSIATDNSAVGTTLASLMTPGVMLYAPDTWDEMDECVRYMLANNQYILELEYDTLTAVTAREYMNLALSVTKSYCEQGYNAVSCFFLEDGYMKLTFGVNTDEGEADFYRNGALMAAIEVHDALWLEGILTQEMSELEKAKVYFQWICENTTYDASADGASVSHLHYSLFTYGKAVCDGYTGAYNLFLKLEDIACVALNNDTHIWTVAALDGVTYHIDSTWGDSGSAPNWAYFAMDEETSYGYHPW